MTLTRKRYTLPSGENYFVDKLTLDLATKEEMLIVIPQQGEYGGKSLTCSLAAFIAMNPR